MLKNKDIALVTGAGGGIGAAIALELSKQNMHVIITGKTLSSLSETENNINSNKGSCTTVQLDMRDLNGIDKLGIEIFNRWGKLDCLVSNAAILGTLGPLHHQTTEEFNDVININLLSNHKLIRSLDFLLKKSKSPKALFLSSSVATNPKSFWGAYAISKAGLEHMIKIWANENINNNFSITIANPGKTRTKMRAQAIPGENKNNLPTPYEVAKKIVAVFFENQNKSKTLNIYNV